MVSADPGTGHSGDHWVLADDVHKMRDLGDHDARLRRIRHLGDQADLVEREPDRGLLPLAMMPYRASGLLDRYCVTHIGAPWAQQA